MTDAELVAAIDRLKAMMISVATGGPRIGEIETEFTRTYDDVAIELVSRGVENPIPYRDLWQWHGRWTSGDLPSWASRRAFVAQLFDPLFRLVRGGRHGVSEPTGWQRVDRAVADARSRLATAKTEEQFQGVGLICREFLISTAQAVYDTARHGTLDGVKASTTDAKRMLEAYIASELGGSSNETMRKHAKAALELASQLVHRRTATFRDAAICIEASASVVNLIAILDGVRDPKT